MHLPQPDEIEITVLGKGHGESAVIHVGDNTWVVVDSLENDKKECVPLRYLRGMGVDVETSVKLVVATHWHDDHIAGISEMVSAAQSADFAMPAPMSDRNFKTFVDAHFSSTTLDLATAVSEIAKIGKILSDPDRPAPILATSGKPLYTLLGSDVSHGTDIRLEALSPSDRDVQHFFLRLLAPLNAPKRGKRRLLPFHENDISVASWLSFGNGDALFGADLETQSAPDRGWNSVLSSTHRPQRQAEIYKVSHHGSKSGDQNDIWSQLLQADPHFVVAPYGLGIGLPVTNDKKRLLTRGSRGYITSSTPHRKYRDTGRGEEKTLGDFGIGIRSDNGNVGRVTMRRKIAPGSPWSVSLEDGAVPLKAFVPRDG